MCLTLDTSVSYPAPLVVFFVDPDVRRGGDGSGRRPWRQVEWQHVNDALAFGHVQVVFSALERDGSRGERLTSPIRIERTDAGPNRLRLDGISFYNVHDRYPTWTSNPTRMRARVRGISTGYDNVPNHRITVLGFEITGSDDKGVYWRAGDNIILDDLIVHDNWGSPAISLEYSSRTRLPSASFIVRNSHVYSQPGECIYIGGSEGLDEDSHEYVEISNNLIHHCRIPISTEHDGINIKDRIGEVVVRRNVVFTTDWGIEAASPGIYTNNLIFDSRRNGFHLNDYWGRGLSGLVLDNNVVIRAGEHGVRLGADSMAAHNVTLVRTTVLESKRTGLVFAGTHGIGAVLDGLVLSGNRVGMDGWGAVDLSLSECLVHGNVRDDDGAVKGTTVVCDHSNPALGDLDNPAGLDNLFFTEDDPWVTEKGARP